MHKNGGKAMPIRRHLNGKYESISKEIYPFREMFLGRIVGIVLKQRRKNDLHVVFQMINEDDGHWFLSTNPTSTHWLEDYKKVITVATNWCKKNCDPDIDIISGVQYGWKFKD